MPEPPEHMITKEFADQLVASGGRSGEVKTKYDALVGPEGAVRTVLKEALDPSTLKYSTPAEVEENRRKVQKAWYDAKQSRGIKIMARLWPGVTLKFEEGAETKIAKYINQKANTAVQGWLRNKKGEAAGACRSQLKPLPLTSAKRQARVSEAQQRGVVKRAEKEADAAAAAAAAVVPPGVGKVEFIVSNQNQNVVATFQHRTEDTRVVLKVARSPWTEIVEVQTDVVAGGPGDEMFTVEHTRTTAVFCSPKIQEGGCFRFSAVEESQVVDDQGRVLRSVDVVVGWLNVPEPTEIVMWRPAGLDAGLVFSVSNIRPGMIAECTLSCTEGGATMESTERSILGGKFELPCCQHHATQIYHTASANTLTPAPFDPLSLSQSKTSLLIR